MPTRNGPVQDFFCQFDLLTNYYQIGTSIGTSDGRPFSFEIDQLFKKKFSKICQEWILPDYQDVFDLYSKQKQEEKAENFDASLQHLFQPSSKLEMISDVLRPQFMRVHQGD